MTAARDTDQGPAQPIAIFTYHQVARPPALGVPYRTLVTSPDKFARQMGLLHTLGYRGLSMRDLEPYLRGEKTGKVVGITLDDGYVNCFENALPVLRYFGFSATCYMVSNQVGGSNVWDLQHGVPEAPLMDVRQMKAWISSGQEIGAHTRNHVNLSRTDEATARQEIAGSRHDLERLLDSEIRHFCYPYGGHGPEHLPMVRESGYVTATTTVEQRVLPGDSLQALPRFTVHRETTQLGLWARMNFGLGSLRGRRRKAMTRPAPIVSPGLHVPG